MTNESSAPPTRVAYWIEWHDEAGQHGVWSGPFLDESVAHDHRDSAQKKAGAAYALVVRERHYTEAQFPQLFHAERAVITQAGVLAHDHIQAERTGPCCVCGAQTPYAEINYQAWLCPGECTAKMDAEFNAAWEQSAER